MNKTKKKLIVLALGLSLVGSYLNYDQLQTPTCIFCEEDDKAFARYSKGKVYIGSKSFLASLDSVNENDILVEDNRNDDDPDMKIYNSCKVTDKWDRYEIINILCMYEKMNPSEWNRTPSSLKVEWFAHNFFYYLNYQTHRTTDVDLNNEDEDVYDHKLLQLLLKL